MTKTSPPEHIYSERLKLSAKKCFPPGTLYPLIVENQEFLSKFMSWAKNISLEESLNNDEQNANNWENEVYEYLIQLDDEIIGIISLKEQPIIDYAIDLGLWISEEHNNKGYGFEAANAVLTKVFPLMNKDKIYYVYRTDNVTSGIVCKKLGFHYEKTVKDNNNLYNIYYKTIKTFNS